MIGYKAFNKDLKCRDFQYEIGKTYEMEEEPIICEKGFHFCKNPIDVFGYYDFTNSIRICKVEALGTIIQEGTKYVTNKIKIVEEIPYDVIEIMIDSRNKYNIGCYNTGVDNTGDYNSGDYNSGNYNSGDYNTGNSNSGNYNSGDSNSGGKNTGDCNSGERNTGNYNTGNSNSGNCNIGDCNTGFDNKGNRNTGACNTGNCNSGNFNIGDSNTGSFNKGNRNTDSRCFWLWCIRQFSTHCLEGV